MPILVSPNPVRSLDTTTTGYTYLVVSYLKADPNIATLKVTLLDNTGVELSYQAQDVSTVPFYDATTLYYALQNGLQPVTVSGTSTSETLQPYTSKTYTPPAGKTWIITVDNGRITSLPGIGTPTREAQYLDYGYGAIVPPGGQVTVEAGAVETHVNIYEIDASTLQPVSFTLKVEELDSSGAVKYTQTATITDYPPVLIITQGAVVVAGVL